MTRVLVTQPIYDDAVVPLQDVDVEVVCRDGASMDVNALADAADGFDGLLTLLTDEVGAEVLTAYPRVQVVANVAAGVDNVDLAAAAAHEVTVTNTPDVFTDATADLTIALMLAVARRVVEGDAQVRAGEYTGWTLRQEPMGLDVIGGCLGVACFGRIGAAVARRAQHGFGMRIAYLRRPLRNPSLAERSGPASWAWTRCWPPPTCSACTPPLAAETRHLIDGAALQRMKPSAILLNTTRRPLVDERALAEALRDGEIAGAGLDVYEHEPVCGPAARRATRAVRLAAAHRSATERTRRRMSGIVARNALAVLTGAPGPNVVDA